jgi:UDP-N-acetylglucosamine 2-epimerase (non-hydrolysing)
MKLLLIAGARPNFMKIAPIIREIRKYSYESIEYRVVHTGQHYDFEMSQSFFEDLEIPKSDFFLEAGSGSHAVQTAKIMVGFEEVLRRMTALGKRRLFPVCITTLWLLFSLVVCDKFDFQMTS